MGVPKAMLPFGPERLLQRLVRRLREAVEPVLVVASPGQELPSLPSEIRVVYDRAEGRGPLEGLHVGLAALGAQSEAAFVVGCNVPMLVPAFVTRMTELLGDYAAAVPVNEGYLQPLAAVYRREVAEAAARFSLPKSGARWRCSTYCPHAACRSRSFSTQIRSWRRSRTSINRPTTWRRWRVKS